MNDLYVIAATSVASVVLVAVGLVVAARRSRDRGLDEPTDMLPLFYEEIEADPLGRHFDEAARLLRGDPDEDFAWLYDRTRLYPYEADFNTISVRRLTRRLERLPKT